MRSVHRIAIAVACAIALVGCKKEPERSDSVAVTVPSAEAMPAEKPAEKPPAAPVAAPAPAAEVGKPAPDFTLTDSAGKTHQLSALRGKNVVLEWFNPDCPFVRFAHGQGPLKDLAQQVAGADLVWLSVNSGAPGKQGHGKERNQQALTDYAMKNPILLDEDGSVGRTYGAAKTPHLFLIDAKGVLVYRGGVDNAPMGTVDAERPSPEGHGCGRLRALSAPGGRGPAGGQGAAAHRYAALRLLGQIRELTALGGRLALPRVPVYGRPRPHEVRGRDDLRRRRRADESRPRRSDRSAAAARCGAREGKRSGVGRARKRRRSRRVGRPFQRLTGSAGSRRRARC